MTSRIFEFGQTLPGYGVPLLNERAVRASAGILFFRAMVTFMQALGLSMFYLIVVQGVIGPINMLVCGTCLLLMFMESAFGICVGCKLHDLLRPQTAQLCPGGACAYTPPEGAGGQWGHLLMLVVFALVMLGVGRWVSHGPDVRGMHHHSLHGQGTVQPAVQSEQTPASGVDAERCKVPEFAKAMGHETIWKQHNGCL